MPIIHRPSPNFDARAPEKRITHVIVHYTGMPLFAEALQRLTTPAAKVSAHYAIGRDGQIFQLVAEQDRAWHTGVSYWRGERDMNSCSIGIELDNPGHQHGYQAFPSVQIDSLKNLLHAIRQRHALPASAVLGHSDIAPARKEDPGELFPWEDLARDGFGLWPRATAPVTAATLTDIAAWLRQLGFECPGDEFDRSFRQTLLAFQRHWHPESMTGTPNAETAARLALLATLMSVE